MRDDGMLVGWAGIRRARTRGDSVILLEFNGVAATVPTVLAHPALVAVRRSAAGPIGSGPFFISAAAGPRMRLESSNGAAVALTVMDGDPRDALDAGVDIVVTRDARALAYGQGLPDYRVVPLPWSELYAVARPRPVEGVLHHDRASMAGIVPVTARAAEADRGHWTRQQDQCSMPATRRAAARQGEPRLVYPAEDLAARGVAERLVAVTDRDLRAVGLPDGAFREALGAGGDWGYVIRLPADPLAPCLALGQLGTAAPWLALAGDSLEIVPLIETRWHAIVSTTRVTGRVQVDGVGTLVVIPQP
jgi:hypothetical protein